MKKICSFSFSAFFLLGLLSLLSFYGCFGKKEGDVKTLNTVSQAKPKTFDPIDIDDRYSKLEASKIYEGLYTYHYVERPYKIIGQLAEGLPSLSEDGQTYKITLKKGVLFQDNKCFPQGKGRELKASDVVYSFKRLADSKLNARGWWVFDNKIVGLNQWREENSKKEKSDYDQVIEGLVALDDYTVQIKLVKASPQFIYILAMPFTYIVAREAVEFYRKDFLNNPVGTGPFMSGPYDQSNKHTYLKNPTFREEFFPSEGGHPAAGKKLPLVEKIVAQFLPEEQPRWLNFAKGNFDFVLIPQDSFDSVVGPDGNIKKEFAEKGVALDKSIRLDVSLLPFNHNLEIFKDIRVRKAFALVFDVKKLIDLFYKNKAIPAQTPIPPGLSGHDLSYRNPYVANEGIKLEEAKKLLAEAGYPEGKGLPPITFDTSSSSMHRQIGEFVKSQLEVLGVNIVVQTNPWSELSDKLHKAKFMLASYAWGADYPDAENFLQLLYSKNGPPGPNVASYNDPVFDQKYLESSSMQDSPERGKLYSELARSVAEQVPWILGVHRTEVTASHGWLQNLITSDFESTYWRHLDIDQEVQKKLKSKL